jgi:hypothetical protein
LRPKNQQQERQAKDDEQCFGSGVENSPWHNGMGVDQPAAGGKIIQSILYREIEPGGFEQHKGQHQCGD